MKKPFRLLLLMLAPVLFILNNLYGQNGVDTSNLLQIDLHHANAVFDKAIGQQSALYNGPQYFFYSPAAIRGSAYFQETITYSGNIAYDGAIFTGVPVIYDLYKDELVTGLPDNASYVALIKDRVKSFDLPGHHFINVNTDSLRSNTPLKSGYYDELYGGRTQALLRTTKTVQKITSSIGTMEAYSIFTPTSLSFFIRKDNAYSTVSSEGELLGILKDRKKQVQAFIKANKIKFRKDPGQALAKIAAYYDTLTN